MVKAKLRISHKEGSPLVIPPASDKLRLVVRHMVKSGVKISAVSQELDNIDTKTINGRLQLLAMYKVIRAWLIDNFGSSVGGSITIHRSNVHAGHRTIVQNRN